MKQQQVYRILLLFLGILIWVSPNITKAQNNQLRAYTLTDGLPQSQVYDIIEDEIGYLWLGTQGGGITRFDGVDFEVFNERNGLLSNYIHALHFSNDSLFIGTKKGLSIKHKNGFSNLQGPQINAIYKNNTKYYLATSQGIFLFEKTGNLRRILLHEEIDNGRINALVFENNWIWIATNYDVLSIGI